MTRDPWPAILDAEVLGACSSVLVEVLDETRTRCRVRLEHPVRVPGGRLLFAGTVLLAPKRAVQPRGCSVVAESATKGPRRRRA
jgi:hypothetical protein